MAKVTLIAHTPEPEKLIAAAAKLCYSPATIEDLMEVWMNRKQPIF